MGSRRLLRPVEGRDVSRKTTQVVASSCGQCRGRDDSGIFRCSGRIPHWGTQQRVVIASSQQHCAIRISASDTPECQVASHGQEQAIEEVWSWNNLRTMFDASAVALPSSPHVITDVEFFCDASVPVFDPLESDEEDELDAFSRNVTGVASCWSCRSKGQPRWTIMMSRWSVAVSLRGCTKSQCS